MSLNALQRTRDVLQAGLGAGLHPGAQIYGFYAYPPLALACGRAIESTQLRGVLLGVEFQGWSRNRGPAAPWNSSTDNVVTQLALVDAALAKEIGE